MKSVLFKTFLVSSFFCVATSGSVCIQPAFAQNRRPADSGCKVGLQAPGFGSLTWPDNSQVSVFILSAHFKTEELPYLLAPFQSWNAVAEATTSRVTFTYAGDVKAPQNCDNCLTIMRGKVFDRKNSHAARLYAYGDQSEQTIIHANIVIDPRITNLRVLSNAIAHELGHNFGLLDCYSCRARSTVMNVVNVSNGLEAPSVCDIAQVKAAYAGLRQRGRASRQSLKIPADEGEEPVEDDTPLVIPATQPNP